ncbi:MAG: acetyl-CoA decarbonylase/synthase complex subunit gamma [bacterium]|nr:acetyl-CoA decarbonylase/synthase complex subunit gamma [bacterium]
MGLTGIEIFKKLPKTNCGECGVPTCLAFAMKLSQGKADLEACPHVSASVKMELSEASLPPIRGVRIGIEESALKIGEETVLFRHDKRFENPPGFAILISDSMKREEIEDKVSQLNTVKFERVGLELKPELVAIKCGSKDKTQFSSVVKTIIDRTKKGIILIEEDVDILQEAVKICKERRPLLYAATAANYETMGRLAKSNNLPLSVKGRDLEELAEITKRLMDMGILDMVIDPGSNNIKRAVEDQTFIRRLALEKTYRPLGFPTITFPCEMTDNPMKEMLYASILVSKYAGIIVLSDLSSHYMFPLLVYRMNIYTDPQRPMTMEQGIYEINGSREDSPVIITTNFSLTYFIVSSEVESSKVPTWLLVMDTEGLSVLTSWAAGKFVPELIASFVKKVGIGNRVSHRKLIIPGYVAQIKGELEEELGGEWEVVVGCREAGDIPAFLQRYATA